MPHLRFRRHYKLLVLLGVLLAALVVGAGARPIVAYSVEGLAPAAGTVTGYAAGSVMSVDAPAGSLQAAGSIWTSSAAGSQ